MTATFCCLYASAFCTLYCFILLPSRSRARSFMFSLISTGRFWFADDIFLFVFAGGARLHTRTAFGLATDVATNRKAIWWSRLPFPAETKINRQEHQTRHIRANWKIQISGQRMSDWKQIKCRNSEAWETIGRIWWKQKPAVSLVRGAFKAETWEKSWCKAVSRNAPSGALSDFFSKCVFGYFWRTGQK